MTPKREAAAPPAEVRETHSAVVVFVGDRAYKVKKPVDLGFLDFREPGGASGGVRARGRAEPAAVAGRLPRRGRRDGIRRSSSATTSW